MKREGSLILLSYLTIYIVWGSTYFFIKIAVESIPPLVLVGFRFFTGGLFFLLFSLLMGKMKPRPTFAQIGSSVLLATLLLLGGNGLISYAEKGIDSYLAALLISSTPLMVAVFDAVILKKRVTLFRIVGIIIGELGVVLLIYDGRSVSTSLSPELVLVILAVLLWSLATSLGHRFKVYPDNTVNAGIQMLFAGSVALIYSLFSGDLTVSSLYGFSTRSIAGLLYLATIGSLAFSAYTYLLNHEPAYRVVSYALVNPVIAVLLGFLAGNESAVPYLAEGFPLILVGLAVMLYGRMIFERIKGRRSKDAG